MMITTLPTFLTPPLSPASSSAGLDPLLVDKKDIILETVARYLDPQLDEKKRRNAEASARYRSRKRSREGEVEGFVRESRDRFGVLESKVTDLQNQVAALLKIIQDHIPAVNKPQVSSCVSPPASPQSAPVSEPLQILLNAIELQSSSS